MDSTLRDGEQTNGVSFLPHEKLMIARYLLHDVGVDRIEVASARVSQGEKDAVKMICQAADAEGKLDKVEVLGFVDGNLSIDWIRECGGQVINLLAKGSLRHCSQQLKKTPREHIEDIFRVLDYADKVGMKVNLYLEDWSGGMKNSPEYVEQVMNALSGANIHRFLLPDTLGILNPLEVDEYITKMVQMWPNCLFDFHGKVIILVHEFVDNEYKTKTISTKRKYIFYFKNTPYENVKVVIIGQDPYHGVRLVNGFFC